MESSVLLLHPSVSVLSWISRAILTLIPADITRYARRPRDQIIGQLAVAPWSASLTATMGIITASCTREIYGEALWNPAAILGAILEENNDSKTKFAVFLVAITFMVGQVGTNFIANLIPFGVDSTALFPRHINIVRGQIICCIVGGWCMVPWKVLISGAVFLNCVTGMGIFMGCLVGIMLGDYFFIRKGTSSCVFT
jgi:NCS1 family nucleobase:cation symporter-1